MNRNPVGWFEIYVQDMSRATRFYSWFQNRDWLPTGGVFS
jgi:predicted enzyme related to lactoylglutathione lyase